MPVEVDYGSEFRYRDPIIDERTAVLAITQTGETVDTLAAMEEARAKGARLWAIVNVIGSQAQRIADGTIAMHAGPEIGVASTKAFTASLTDLYLLGCYLGEQRGVLRATSCGSAGDRPGRAAGPGGAGVGPRRRVRNAGARLSRPGALPLPGPRASTTRSRWRARSS